MADRDEKTVPYEIDVRIVGDLAEVFLAVRLAIGDLVELMSHKHATTPEEQRDLKCSRRAAPTGTCSPASGTP